MVPDAKIIMSLRNPVERAFSHYYMEHKLGYVNVPIEDIVMKKTKHRNAHLWYQQYIELGLYSAQIKRYLDTFGKDQVRIFIYEEISENIEAMILSVFDFLGIDRSYIPELEDRYNTYSTPRNMLFRLIYAQKNLRTLARKIIPSDMIEQVKNFFLSRSKKYSRREDTVAAMKELFKPDILELEKLINKNLSRWYE